MQIAGPLRQRVAAMLKKARVPGCSVAVWRAGAQATANFGLSDVEAQRHVESSTVFHLFSGTKLYTAAAVMLLRERGLVELDGPVGDYVGDLRLRNPISVRQLLSHSSGLADTLAGFLAVHFEGTPMPSSAAALARYRTDQGKRPGRKAAYRNVNYAILGELVTRVSGVPYVQFVQTQLLGPLKSGATFTYNSENQPHAAVGYISRFNSMRWLLRFMMPEVSRQLERARLGSLVPLNQYTLDTAAIGGLLGCATDFLPMASELLKTTNGILSADSKREMLTVQSPGAAGIASRVGVGIGWKCGRHRGVEFWNHEGGGAGFTSETRIYPDTNLAVVILMNATQSKKLSMLAHEICELLQRDLASA